MHVFFGVGLFIGGVNLCRALFSFFWETGIGVKICVYFIMYLMFRVLEFILMLNVDFQAYTPKQ